MECTAAHWRMLQKVLEHSSVYDSSRDDGFTGEIDQTLAVKILNDPNTIVLMPHKNTAFMFRPLNHIMYEMHVAIVEGDTRKKGIKHAVSAARWMFNQTPCRKVVSHIPAINEHAIIYAKVCGMEHEGLLKDAFLKDGELHDLVVLAATKEKFNRLYGG